MKSLYSLLLLLCCCCAISHGQAVYPSTSYGNAGDSSYESYAALDSLYRFNFQTAGANISWNYAALRAVDQFEDRFQDPNTAGYRNTFINECVAGGRTRVQCTTLWNSLTNLAHKQADSVQLSTLKFRNIMDNEEKTTTALTNNIIGYTLVGNGPQVPVAVKFTRPDTILHFPLQYGNADSCNSYYTFNLSTIGINFVLKEHHKRVNHVEGYGNLTTPYRNYPAVLKVKTTITYRDTVVYNGVAIPINNPTQVQYKWFDPNFKRAVLNVNTKLVAGQQVVTSIAFIDTAVCLTPVISFTRTPYTPYLNSNTHIARELFVNNSLNANSITWNFGDPASGANNTSTAGIATHNYTAIGNYTVTLIACNTVCQPQICDTSTQTVVVIDSSVVRANFSFNPIQSCLPDTVRFTNLSINATSYFWDFGDGTNAVTTNAVHSYTSAGTFTVKLFAFNTNGRVDSIRRNVTVSTPPVASIAANGSLSFCQGDSVRLTASGGSFYNWNTRQLARTITVKNSGLYTVTVTNACGTSTASTSVSVSPSFVPALTINPSTNNICTGTIVTYTALPTNGGATPTYQWKLNGAAVGTNSPTYVSGTNLNNGDVVSCLMTSSITTCISPDTAAAAITMLVSSSVKPSVTIASNPAGPSYCQGSRIVFRPNALGGGNTPVFQWYLNGVNVSNVDSFATSSINNNDSLRLVMTSSAACASPQIASVTQSLIVKPVTRTNDVQGICAGLSYGGHNTTGTFVDTFAASNGCDSIRTLNLTVYPIIQDTINKTICNTQNYAGYTATGTYIDTFLSVHGCDSIRVLNLTVNPNDTAAIVITPSSNNICTGTPVSFTAAASYAGTTPTYQWTVNGTTVGTNSASFAGGTYNNGDIIKVVLTSSLACAIPNVATDSVVMQVSGSVTPSVKIASSIAPPFCQGTSVTFYANISGGGNTPTIIWRLNGTIVSNVDSFTTATLNNGDILKVNIVSSAACASPTIASATDTIVVLPVPHTNITTSICPGTDYTGHTTAGTFVDTFAAVNGCDSIRTLNLSVYPTISDTVTATICSGDNVAGYQLSGTYVDIYTAANGCDSTRTLILTVNPTYAVNLNITSCDGASVFGHDSSGAYIDTLHASSGCDSLRFVVLNIVPRLANQVKNNGTTLSIDTTGISSYQWYRNDTLIVGADSASYTYTATGTYMVVASNALGCTDTSVAINITGLGIANITTLANIQMYPNPTDGKLTVVLPTNAQGYYQIDVLNALGQRALPLITTSNSTQIIDLSNNSAGLYLVRIKYADLLYSYKVTKQ